MVCRLELQLRGVGIVLDQASSFLLQVDDILHLRLRSKFTLLLKALLTGYILSFLLILNVQFHTMLVHVPIKPVNLINNDTLVYRGRVWISLL